MESFWRAGQGIGVDNGYADTPFNQDQFHNWRWIVRDGLFKQHLAADERLPLARLYSFTDFFTQPGTVFRMKQIITRVGQQSSQNTLLRANAAQSRAQIARRGGRKISSGKMIKVWLRLPLQSGMHLLYWLVRKDRLAVLSVRLF